MSVSRMRFASLLVATSALAGACDSKPAPESTTNSLAVEKKAPSPPAGPVPIPYPNVAAAPAPTSSAKVGAKEVKLKNQSSFEKTTGD